MTSYALGCNPTGIVAAKDGNLWVLCPSNKLVSVTTSGVVSTITEAYSLQFYADSITLGADGNPWFAASTNHAIGKVDTTVDSLTFYIPPGAYGSPVALAQGPDGNMWAVDDGSNVDVYIMAVISVSPASLTFSSLGSTQTITVTEANVTAWTATSTKPSVATVTTGGSANKFNVTSVASGSTKIIVSDSVGNSFVVHVSVK